MLTRIAEFAKDAIYPRRCAGCGARGMWLCDICRDTLDLFHEPWCARCGIPPVLAGCRCSALPPQIAAARSVGPFNGWLRNSIVALKYQDEADRASHLAAFLAAVVPAVASPVLVPVPLHPSRERARGYNQSALLARSAATMLGVPCDMMVERVRDTQSQVGLEASERAANMAGAFRVVPGLGRDLSLVTPVLVDDVLTTGATLAACAQPLLDAGAPSVVVVTLARQL
jgi:ComF family protein